MKRLLIILILLLAACQPAPVCNDPYIQVGNNCCLDENKNKICDNDEPTEDIEEIFEEIKEEQITEEELELQNVDKVLKMAEDRVKSYTFVTNYDKYDGSTWYIKDNMVRIDLHDALTLKPGEFIDILVFNHTNNEVNGYCRRMEHVCKDSLEREFSLDWDDYWDDTPLDIMKSYKNKKDIKFREQGEIIEDRMATLIVFQDGQTETSIWVDAHYGVPLRIIKKRLRDERVTTFDSMAFNTIKDDVFHAFNVRPRSGRS